MRRSRPSLARPGGRLLASRQPCGRRCSVCSTLQPLRCSLGRAKNQAAQVGVCWRHKFAAQPRILPHAAVVHRPRPAKANINDFHAVVANNLHVYGVETLAIVVITGAVRGCSNGDVCAINGTNQHGHFLGVPPTTGRGFEFFFG